MEVEKRVQSHIDAFVNGMKVGQEINKRKGDTQFCEILSDEENTNKEPTPKKIKKNKSS